MSEGNSHFLAALERVDAGRVVEEAPGLFHGS